MMRQPYLRESGILKPVWTRSLKLLKKGTPDKGHDLHGTCQAWTQHKVGLDITDTNRDSSRALAIHRDPKEQSAFRGGGSCNEIDTDGCSTQRRTTEGLLTKQFHCDADMRR